MTGTTQDWSWGHSLNGRAILAEVKQRLASFRPEFEQRGTSIAILRFEPPLIATPLELAKYRAAETSMQQKEKSFRALGCHVESIAALSQDTATADFAALLNRLNSNPQVRGIIVQYPVPARLAEVVPLIAPDKDLDALGANSPFTVPATSEGVVRLLQPFADQAIVAVVGANGFVGRGVVQELQALGIAVLPLDQSNRGFRLEDLLQVRDADILVSATGQPELLDERHLAPYHRLVVDSGYVPMAEGQLYGDIRASARAIAQNYTPVPGGIGPTEMAVLMERLVRKEITTDIEAWQLASTDPTVYFTQAEVQQQQMIWAVSVYQDAAAMFSQRIDAEPEALQIRASGEILLEGQNYSLRIDQNQRTLSIEGAKGRGTLAVYELN